MLEEILIHCFGATKILSRIRVCDSVHAATKAITTTFHERETREGRASESHLDFRDVDISEHIAAH